jgi:hypothetical protein
LLDRACDLGAGASCQRVEFRKGVLAADTLAAAQFDADQDRAFDAIGGKIPG